MTSVASSPANAWTNDGERNMSSEGTAGGGAVVVPVPKVSSVPANEINMLAREMASDGAPTMGMESAVGFANVAAAVERHTAQLSRTAARDTDGASRPSLEKSSCWLSASSSRLPTPDAHNVAFTPLGRLSIRDLNP